MNPWVLLAFCDDTQAGATEGAPECYGCLGTGRFVWAGIPPNPCLCVQWCPVHEDTACDCWENLLEAADTDA